MKHFPHYIADWMNGTEGLSHGAYRAYHVIVQLIYLHEGPITLNERGLAGRCNMRPDHFRKYLNELLTVGKVTCNDNVIDVYRCSNELLRYSYSNSKRSNTLKNKGAREVTPPKERKKEIYTSEFEVFWNTYPRKEAKRTAFKAWQEAKKRASVDRITAGAKAVSGEVDAGKELKYVKHPASWLNADGWLDEKPKRKIIPQALLEMGY